MWEIKNYYNTKFYLKGGEIWEEKSERFCPPRCRNLKKKNYFDAGSPDINTTIEMCRGRNLNGSLLQLYIPSHYMSAPIFFRHFCYFP